MFSNDDRLVFSDIQHGRDFYITEDGSYYSRIRIAPIFSGMPDTFMLKAEPLSIEAVKRLVECYENLKEMGKNENNKLIR